MNPPSAFALAPAQPTLAGDEFEELKTALLLPPHAREATFSLGKQGARNHLIAMAADGVQAFAKLQGESFVYYVQSLSLTLGRAVAGREPVDVDLGPSRSISRVHARIDYDFQLRQFVISPLGKNGIVIDGFPYSKNHTPIPLKSKSCIQIGDVTFFFLLPVGHISNAMPPMDNPVHFSVAALSSTAGTRAGGKTLSQPDAQRSPSPEDDGAGESDLDQGDTGGDDHEEQEQEQEQEADDHDHGAEHAASGPVVTGADGQPLTKPTYSYATLISQAISSTRDKRITLAGIYQFITQTYPYYRTIEPSGWQNSIRHNLSLNKAFMRMPRGQDEPGKGAFWVIDPAMSHLFEAGIYKGRSRAAAAAAARSRNLTSGEPTRHSSRPRPRLKNVNTSPGSK